MANISEAKWKKALTAIFKKLERPQYKKMVEFYEKNQGPAQKRLTAKFKEELPEKLIQMFGMDGSISLVNEAMKEIPRNDPGVQNLLLPFVDKLGKNQENQAEGSKTRCRPEQMSNILEDVWKHNMTTIFRKLERSQYKKMVEFYEKNQGPSQKRLTAKFKEELPEKLIQTFGIDGSMSLVNEAMKEIPRNDPGVQNLLRPFVDKLGKNQENQAEGPKIRGRPEQMSNISEDVWKHNMTMIFRKLERSQYKKMVEFYEKNQGPSQKRITAKFKRELPEKLFQRFGIEGSISLVNEAMKEIPRNDPGVQNLLRPFVDKLETNQENQAEGQQTRIQAEQATTSHERLLSVIEDLNQKEVRTFKWHLKSLHRSPGPLSIPASRVEMAESTDLVDLILQVYTTSALEIAKKILEKMQRNDLVQTISCACS